MLLAAVPAWAAPFGLQIGDTRLGFDVPPGFSDSLPTGSPRLQELAESFTPAANRILVFALSDADMRRFNTGDAPEMKQYLLVITPRAQEYERMNAAAFEAYARDSLRAMGTPVEGDIGKVLEARRPGEPALLADLLREPDAVSLMRGVRLPPADTGLFGSKPSQYVLSTSTLILLRGKVLTLTVTSGYETKADAEWLRSVTLRWIEELRRLNASR